MAETVTSIFRPRIKTITIVAGILTWGTIALLICFYVYDGTNDPGTEVVFGVLGFPALFYIYLKPILKRFLKVTAGADGLVFHYLLTNKKIVIDYAEISHVESDGVNPGRWYHHQFVERNSTNEAQARLQICLNTGAKFYIDAANYSNYDELKEAIRRHRFNLP